MSKSYTPLRPKPRKKPPTWTSPTNRVTRFATRDAVWEGVVHREGGKVAWRDARGFWREVELVEQMRKDQ